MRNEGMYVLVSHVVVVSVGVGVVVVAVDVALAVFGGLTVIVDVEVVVAGSLARRPYRRIHSRSQQH